MKQALALERPVFSLRLPRLRLLAPTLLAVLLIIANFHSYLLFHTLTEFFAIVVAILAAVVAWQTYPFSRNHFLMYLASGYFWIAMLDLAHALTQRDLGIFRNLGVEQSIQFWIIARGFEALLFLTAPFFLDTSLKRRLTFSAFGLATVLFFWWVIEGEFPHVYRRGEGPNGLKIALEYLIIGLLTAAAAFVSVRRSLLDESIYRLVMLAILTTIVSEACFTLYREVEETINVTGHILKLYSYWFIFVITARVTLAEPFRAMARDASTYDAVPTPILLVDRQGYVRQANQAAKVLLERVAGAADHCHSMFHDPLTSPSACPLCRAILDGENVHGAEVYRTQDDRWYHISISPVLAPGQSTGVVHVVQDISERKKAEQELSRWAQIFEKVDWGVAVYAPDTTLLMMNPAFARMHGYTVDELLNKPAANLIPLEYRRENRYHAGVTTQRGHHLFEALHMRKDGSIFPVLEDVTVVHDACGGVLRAAHVRDISEQHRVQEALRRSEAVLAEAEQLAHLGSWDLELSSGRLTWSAEEYRLLGYEPGAVEPTLEAFWAVVHPEDRRRVEEAMQRSLAGQGGECNIEHRVRLADGSERHVMQRGRVHFDAIGRPRRFAGATQDITELKRDKEEILHSRERLRELASHLQNVREEERAHLAREIHDELGGTLMALKMDVSWLGRCASLDEEQGRKIASMASLADDAIGTLRRIITDLRPTVLDDFGLFAAIEWQIQEYERRTGIRCRIDMGNVDERLDLSKEVAVALFRILQESLTNVLRHAQANRVWVRLAVMNDALHMEVEDDGCGIEDGQIRQHGSYGILGMNERAYQIGGTLLVTAGEGGGTRVAISVPVSARITAVS